mgnify:CR=1 FL=1
MDVNFDTISAEKTHSSSSTADSTEYCEIFEAFSPILPVLSLVEIDPQQRLAELTICIETMERSVNQLLDVIAKTIVVELAKLRTQTPEPTAQPSQTPIPDYTIIFSYTLISDYSSDCFY